MARRQSSKDRRSRSSKHGAGAACRSCGYSFQLVQDYLCPSCGRFAIELYRREHVDPVAARHMSRAEIEREFAAAGMPFAPLGRARRVA